MFAGKEEMVWTKTPYEHEGRFEHVQRRLFTITKPAYFGRSRSVYSRLASWLFLVICTQYAKVCRTNLACCFFWITWVELLSFSLTAIEGKGFFNYMVFAVTNLLDTRSPLILKRSDRPAKKQCILFQIFAIKRDWRLGQSYALKY